MDVDFISNTTTIDAMVTPDLIADLDNLNDLITVHFVVVEIGSAFVNIDYCRVKLHSGPQSNGTDNYVPSITIPSESVYAELICT